MQSESLRERVYELWMNESPAHKECGGETSEPERIPETFTQTHTCFNTQGDFVAINHFPVTSQVMFVPVPQAMN